MDRSLSERISTMDGALGSHINTLDLTLDQRTASFEALHDPERQTSRFVFIDAVEPKKAKPENAAEPDFPDTIELSYALEVHFKANHAEQKDPAETLIR